MIYFLRLDKLLQKRSGSKRKKKVVVVSGGFDPIHKGHVTLFREAKKLGDELVIILNNDNWLRLKKGAPFMTEDERKEILKEMRSVDRVIITQHQKDSVDMSVSQELEKLKPDIFANGGDRVRGNVPEVEICQKIGCEMIFNVGGKKTQSSSWLLEEYFKRQRSTKD